MAYSLPNVKPGTVVAGILATASAVDPEPISRTILAVGAQVAGMLGKSPQQTQAEYWASALTNEVEAALDLNRFCFWTGLISQGQCLQNYDYLWSLLAAGASQLQSVSPAQASRMIRDRDYGGQFAQEWRGQFLEEVEYAGSGQNDSFGDQGSTGTFPLQDGFVPPEWWWSWPDRAKFTAVDPLTGPVGGQVTAMVQAGVLATPAEGQSLNTGTNLTFRQVAAEAIPGGGGLTSPAVTTLIETGQVQGVIPGPNNNVPGTSVPLISGAGGIGGSSLLIVAVVAIGAILVLR